MIWLDAHLSPRLAGWIQEQLGHDAIALREIGLRDADDIVIFEKAREVQSVIITKDGDFAEMVGRLGSPTKIIWLRCGNTTEASLIELLAKHLDHALDLLASGEQLVEIR
jgi:predicted nuclease of predicted toxin-antitoxin system